MKNIVKTTLAICLALFGMLYSSFALAVDAPVYVDTNTNGQFDAGETNASFTGGNGGSTNIRRFDFPADRVTASDTLILNISFIDNSMRVAVNGTEIFAPQVGQFENVAGAFTRFTFAGTYMTTPWVANTNGLPRVRVTITPAGVIVQGTRNTTSTTLEPMTTTAGGFAIPGFVAGQNTIQVINPNEGGPDAISGNIVASYTPVTRGITLTKTPSVSSVSTGGTLVTYSLGVANNGNVPVTGLTLTDSLGPVVCPITGNATITSIPVGSSVSCSTTYTVSLADLDNRGGGDGDIDNNASVSGTQQGQAVSSNASAVVTLTFTPQLTFAKSVPPSTPSPLVLNQIVTYRYDVTNTGNVTMTNINISDTHGGYNTDPLPANETIFFDGSPLETSTDVTLNDGVWSVLRPGDTVRFTGTYTVNQTDIDLLQ